MSDELYGWNEAEHAAEETYSLDKGRVYKVGWRYLVYVLDDGRVAWREEPRRTYDPRATLPNMDVAEGEIRIPLTDLVGLCLSRLPPEEIARALWSDPEVRKEFMTALVERYSEGALEHADRLAFLAGVREAIHSKDQQELLNAMVGLEHHAAQRSFFWHETHRVNERLAELGCVDHEGKPVRLRTESDDPDLRISGKYWDEAREWWRAEILKRFPGA